MSEEDFLIQKREQWFNELGWSEKEVISILDEIKRKNYNKVSLLVSMYYNYISNLKKTKGKESVGRVHWNINRFYYSLKIYKYLSVIDMFLNREELRSKFRIRPSDTTVDDENLWMVIAGIYVNGIERREKKVAKSRALKAIYPPKKWMNLVKSKKRSDFDVRTEEEIKAKLIVEEKDQARSISDEEASKNNYLRFIFDLNNNWGLFIAEYENPHTYHGVPLEGGGEDFATLDEIERGYIPARGKKIIFTGCYKLTLEPQVEKMISISQYPKRLSEYITDLEPTGLYASILKEREIYLNRILQSLNQSGSSCRDLDKLPNYLKVGLNPRFQYPKFNCKNIKPYGIR